MPCGCFSKNSIYQYLRPCPYRASPVGTVRQSDEREIAKGARRIEELVCIFMMARAEGLAWFGYRKGKRWLQGFGISKGCTMKYFGRRKGSLLNRRVCNKGNRTTSRQD
jgi:hypothetical protein